MVHLLLDGNGIDKGIIRKKSKSLYMYDLIVVGAGGAGMISAITAARDNKKVLLLEKLSQLGLKLKATGGGKCNLTNTLSSEEFMESFGRNGRFMITALNAFDNTKVIEFFTSLGVKTASKDGFRIFPDTHDSTSVLDGFKNELQRLNIDVKTDTKVEDLIIEDDQIKGVKTSLADYLAPKVILSTGGLGYPTLGANGDGHKISENFGHKITPLYPAMMPLFTKETWVASCTADTIAKVTMRVDMKKHKKLNAFGDLIFTKKGIRGPVVLDFARELTPLIEKYGEVSLLVNMTKGKNEEQIRSHLKNENTKDGDKTILDLISSLLPLSVSKELLKIVQINEDEKYNKIDGIKRDQLIKILVWTPLTINGHDGFKNAMITRGGVSLKQIDPNTMQSKLISGLYFCGEIVDLDGPCGGYNLQWSFSSGYLAGKLL